MTKLAHRVLDVSEPVEEQVIVEDNFMQKVFDSIKAITETKEELVLDDEWLNKAIFIITKAVSFYPDCVHLCNEANKLTRFSPRTRYDFLMKTIVKGRRTKRKWPKRIEDDRLPFIQKYYNYNRLRANEVLSVLTKQQINNIISKMNELGGVLNE